LIVNGWTNDLEYLLSKSARSKRCVDNPVENRFEEIEKNSRSYCVIQGEAIWRKLGGKEGKTTSDWEKARGG
jgi:hypothetical protein